jgi:hypothetical protein
MLCGFFSLTASFVLVFALPVVYISLISPDLVLPWKEPSRGEALDNVPYPSQWILQDTVQLSWEPQVIEEI